MKSLFALLLLILPFSFHTDKESIPDLKKIIHVSKSEIHYIYKDKRDDRQVIYQLKNGVVFISFLKNKKVELQLKNQKGKISYKTQEVKRFGPLSKAAVKKLPKDFKHFFKVHLADQNEFNKPLKEGGANLANGIAQTWSNEDAINNGTSQSGSENECTQTGTCQCGSTTRKVTCPCMTGIYCEEREASVCDYDDAGNEVNCRNVTVCVPMCL